MRFTIRVRSRTRLSRSRFGRRASSSSTVGITAIVQCRFSPRSQPRNARISSSVSRRSVSTHMSLDSSLLRPTRQPEAVASGLVGNRDPIDQLSRQLGFVTPAMQQLQQCLRISVEFLERPALKAWNNRCDEPLRLAHLDHNNQRGILVESVEEPGRVKWNRVASNDCDMVALLLVGSTAPKDATPSPLDP